MNKDLTVIIFFNFKITDYTTKQEVISIMCNQRSQKSLGWSHRIWFNKVYVVYKLITQTHRNCPLFPIVSTKCCYDRVNLSAFCARNLKLRFLHQIEQNYWATSPPFPQALDEKRTASSHATCLSSWSFSKGQLLGQKRKRFYPVLSSLHLSLRYPLLHTDPSAITITAQENLRPTERCVISLLHANQNLPISITGFSFYLPCIDVAVCIISCRPQKGSTPPSYWSIAPASRS